MRAGAGWLGLVLVLAVPQVGWSADAMADVAERAEAAAERAERAADRAEAAAVRVEKATERLERILQKFEEEMSGQR